MRFVKIKAAGTKHPFRPAAGQQHVHADLTVILLTRGEMEVACDLVDRKGAPDVASLALLCLSSQDRIPSPPGPCHPPGTALSTLHSCS